MDTDIKRGDRVRRKTGGPAGVVIEVFTAWNGKGTRRARVQWDAQQNGRRRIGGGASMRGYIAVASLEREPAPEHDPALAAVRFADPDAACGTCDDTGTLHRDGEAVACHCSAGDAARAKTPWLRQIAA